MVISKRKKNNLLCIPCKGKSITNPAKMQLRLSLPLILSAMLLLSLNVNAQGTGKIAGKITDIKGNPLEFANIAIAGSTVGASTDAKGNFELNIQANIDVSVIITSIGYYKEILNLRLASGEKRIIARSLRESTIVLADVVVEDQQLRTTNLSRINPKNAEIIPSVSGGIEALIKTLPGVSSNNELSSQYSVRGGNYDENLVYVNDIEIYRPFLVRSGQQEGLSFLNSDLVSSILFSAGGFDARYGDKMSSVLDIRYKRPTTFAGSFSASLLGASAHVEGASDNRRFTYLMGMRQKSNQYLLGGLDTKGEYRPSFTDVQGLLTYDLNKKIQFSFLGNYARNAYNLVPTSRETKFGTQDMPLRLTIYFDGKEVDRFNNYMGAFSLTYKPQQNTQLRWTVSAFQSHESETYDIQGQYWIANLQNNPGDSIEVTETSGIGTFLNHARNYLDATVINAEHRGAISNSSNYLQWAVKYQHEFIDDRMNEWVMIDSTGYSIPYPGGIPGQTGNNGSLSLSDVVHSKNSLSSNRYSGFVQNMFVLDGDSSHISLTAGLRANYWDIDKQLLISPRAAFSYKPNWKNDILFRLSGGLYYQPPFYRELRDFEGNLNTSLKAQTSIHFVIGSDWNFLAWNRPFKFVTEIYYKYLDNLVPYEVDNVRIRYYAKNNARGYATGIDMKVNGEFVKGIESWASLSIMQTREDIKDDYYYNYYNKSDSLIIPGRTVDQFPMDSLIQYPGYIPRPADQRINFGLFFQDYLPRNPTYKMHLTLMFGSSLPFGAPGTPRFKQIFRMPPYRRVDIGFSKQIKSEDSQLRPGNFINYFKTIWISAEIFNLLQVNNTVSYIWVKDSQSRQYAVPNYLTSRQLNIKLQVTF